MSPTPLAPIGQPVTSRTTRAERPVTAVRAAALLLLLSFGSAGCSLATSGAKAGVSVGEAAVSEGGLSGSGTDARIRLAVNRLWFERSEQMFTRLGLLVRDRRVLLHGWLPSAELKAEAEQLVWRIPGIRVVYNEIWVGEQPRLLDEGQDALITKKLGTHLFIDRDVRDANFDYGASDGVVFIVGTARSEAERTRVMARAGDVRYVRHVVARIDLTDRAPN